MTSGIEMPLENIQILRSDLDGAHDCKSCVSALSGYFANFLASCFFQTDNSCIRLANYKRTMKEIDGVYLELHVYFLASHTW